MTPEMFAKLGLKTIEWKSGLKSAQNEAAGFVQRTQAKLDRINLKRAALQVTGFATLLVYTTKRLLIDTSRDADEIDSKFSVVFRNLAGEADAWSKSYSLSAGRAQQDVKKWMSTLQDTFVPLGFSRDKAYELSKSLTTLAVDVASFNNAADDEVLSNFTSTLVGNHEAVRSYGIVITEAALKQEALRLGMTKKFEALTNLEKVTLRYNLLMAGSSDAQGDAARTAMEAANQEKRLLAHLVDIRKEAGDRLLPTYTNILNNMNSWIENNGRFIDQKLDEYMGEIADILERIANSKDVFVKLSDGALQFADNILTIKENISYISTGFQSTYAKAYWGVFDFLTGNKYKPVAGGGGLDYSKPAGSALYPNGQIYKTAPWVIPFDVQDGMKYVAEVRNRGAANAAAANTVVIQANTVQTPSPWGLGLGGGNAANVTTPSLNRGTKFTPYTITSGGLGAQALPGVLESLGNADTLLNEFYADLNRVPDYTAQWQAFGDTLSMTLAQGLQTAGNVFEGIGNAFTNMLKNMAAQLAARAAVFQLLNIASGGSIGTFGSFVFRGFAAGGSVSAGHPVMVGESGREVFIPNTSGRIVPNHKVAAGDSYSISVTFAGGETPAVRSQVEAARYIKAAVRDNTLGVRDVLRKAAAS